MKQLLPWLTVFLVGVLVGWGALKMAEASAEAAVERQKTELATLSAQLHDKEAALAAGQARIDDQAATIHKALIQAEDLSDQVLAAQGSAIERLKKVLGVIQQLRAELNSLN